MPGVRRTAAHAATAVDLDDDRRKLQQRVGTGVKAAGLDVDDNGQVAAEATCSQFADGLTSPPAQHSPARMGTTIAPKG
jgi:hypothetical protein